jgi:hypothetical protein
MNHLLKLFPTILPLAVQWAEAQEALILKEGAPLSAQGLSDAKLVGVANPEKIRLLKVSRVPMPAHPVLMQAAQETGLISPDTGGMAIRYGIFVRHDCWTDRSLIAHECVHTSQYERFGGIRQFLERYLRECVEIGYPGAPLEQEAVQGAAKILG